ncbi:MAG: hypothetical protein RIB03_11900 [Henriciella sp.]|uniref:hypothetical protein n=1 Tax=Henriciella sp. TaxID=1968823 RepID=UPI0032EC5A58
MKQIAPILTAVLLGACTTQGAGMADDPSGEPMPQVCNVAITDTSAWKDRMPGPEGANGNLVVMLEVENDDISRRFESQGIRDDGTLVLDIVEWDQPAGIGKIVFRQKGISPDRVEIRCGGETVKTIEEIMDVY